MEFSMLSLMIGTFVLGAVVVLVLGVLQKRGKSRAYSGDEDERPGATTYFDSSSFERNRYLFIPDQYSGFEELQAALRTAGLESSNLIVGIDYTKSNDYNGEKTFFGRSLHGMDVNDPYTGDKISNPYQQVISTIARTLEGFDDDNLIPAFGFGDEETKGDSVFPFFPNRAQSDANGVDEVLRRYNEITPDLIFSGPTNFAPLIRKAVEIVKKKGQYHILLIIADGEVVKEEETRAAIVEAANHPLSIVTIGVGDGPFEAMHRFDDALAERRFDNVRPVLLAAFSQQRTYRPQFQFVNYSDIMTGNFKNVQVEFARQALQEVPDQYRAIKHLGLLR